LHHRQATTAPLSERFSLLHSIVQQGQRKVYGGTARLISCLEPRIYSIILFGRIDTNTYNRTRESNKKFSRLTIKEKGSGARCFLQRRPSDASRTLSRISFSLARARSALDLEIAAHALAVLSSCSKDLTLSRRPLLSGKAVEDSPAVEVPAGALES
jgi:hypothetical protein